MMTLDGNWESRLAESLLHFVWQATIIGALFAGVMRLLRYASAEARHAVCVATLLLLTACVPLTLLWGIRHDEPVSTRVSMADLATSTSSVGETTPSENELSALPTATGVAAGLQSGLAAQERPASSIATSITSVFRMPGRDSLQVLLTVYLLGLVFFASRLIVGTVSTRRYRREAQPLADPAHRLIARRAAQAARLAAVPTILWCCRVAVPSVVGLLRPAIYLPCSLATSLRPDELQQLLLHEMHHLRRYDHIVNFVQNVAEVFLFFHPVVWWVSRRLRLEREYCCDAAVLAGGGSAVDYADLLVRVAELARKSRGPAPAVAATGPASHLRLRVDSLLGLRPAGRQATRLRESASLAAVLALSVVAGLAATPELLRAQNAEAPATADSDQQPAEAVENQTAGGRPPAPNEVAGVVTDASGRPVAGALVDAWTWYLGDETSTDEQGRFRLPVETKDPGYRIELRITAEGYSPWYNPTQPLGEVLNVPLDNKTLIEGRVTDAQGQPVARTEVHALQGEKKLDGGRVGDVRTTTRTDADGRYRVYVYPDTYQLVVSSPQQGTARVPDVVVPADTAVTQDIQLKNGVRFTAQVVDAVSGQPAPDVVLWSWREPLFSGRSDANGRIVIENMPPGEFEFSVGYGEGESVPQIPIKVYRPKSLGRWWSPQAVDERQREKIDEGRFQRNIDDLTFDLRPNMEEVEIFVEPAATFTGRVVDPEGNPVAGATVSGAQTGSGNSLTGDTRYSVRTAEDGTFTAHIPAGKDFAYNLIAHDGDHREFRRWAAAVTEPLRSQPGQRIEGLVLQLNRPATVRGRVAGSSEQVGALEVRAVATDLRGNRYYDPTTRTRADGTFELGFIRPGRHSIQVGKYWFPPSSGAAGQEVIVVVAEGQTVEGVELTAPAKAPSGVEAGMITLEDGTIILDNQSIPPIKKAEEE